MPSASHRKLTSNQIHTLKLLYKFRFLSPGLLAEYRGTTTWSAQNTFNILSGYALVGKRHSKLHKIDRKPASYHLTPLALKLLRDEYGFNELVLHARYKDRTVRQSFIENHLSIINIYLSIRKEHPNGFKMFTKYEIHGQTKFPEQLPDLYLQRKKSHPKKPDEIVIDYIPANQQKWVTKKRVDQYLEHFESSSWPAQTYPAVLFYVENNDIAVFINKYASERKDSLLIERNAINIGCKNVKEQF